MTGPTGSFGASSDQFLSLTRTNDSASTSVTGDMFRNATGANNTTPRGITFTPSDGRFTISTPGTYCIEAMIIFDPTNIQDLTTFTVQKNGSNVWSYPMRIYGSATVAPAPVPLILYLDLVGGDYLNFVYDATGLAVAKAGSTLNITRISVGPTGATGFTGAGATGVTGVTGPTGPIFSGGTLTSLDMTGPAYLKQFSETISTITEATGVITHDWLSSAIFYHSSMAANFTANVMNLPTTAQRSYTLSLLLNQGANAYYASALQIDGSSQTINWANGATPVPLANKKEIETVTLINTSQTLTPSWLVFGDYGTYG